MVSFGWVISSKTNTKEKVLHSNMTQQALARMKYNLSCKCHHHKLLRMQLWNRRWICYLQMEKICQPVRMTLSWDEELECAKKNKNKNNNHVCVLGLTCPRLPFLWNSMRRGVQSSFKLHQTEIGFSSLSVNLSQRCCFMGSYLGFC